MFLVSVALVTSSQGKACHAETVLNMECMHTPFEGASTSSITMAIRAQQGRNYLHSRITDVIGMSCCMTGTSAIKPCITGGVAHTQTCISPT